MSEDRKKEELNRVRDGISEEQNRVRCKVWRVEKGEYGL